MTTREWLAHNALRAAATYIADRQNRTYAEAFSHAADLPCPECERAIIYCRCWETAPHPHRDRTRETV